MKRIACCLLLLTAWTTSWAYNVRDSYEHYSEWLVESEMQRVAHPYFFDGGTASKPRWSYSASIEVESMFDTFLMYGNEAVGDYVSEYPATMIDASGAIYKTYKVSDYNLDNVRPGHFLIRYYHNFPDAKELTALNTLFGQLENQQRTQEGVWWHKAIYANQVWLDGIFMGLPFYVMAAPLLRPDDATAIYDDAVDQIVKTERRTYDEATGLWKHAWDETSSMFWADAETGLSQHTWARALGWFSMAMLEVLEALPADYARRGEVLQLFQKVMAAVLRYQDKETGVWMDVLDVADSRNYVEATASSMFTYCMLKGARLGLLDQSYQVKGIEAYRNVVRQFIVKNNDGRISLARCCQVSGLGPDSSPNRDGSFEYYMSEPIVENDPKGVGPFVWASLEAERLGYTVGNLFDTDEGGNGSDNESETDDTVYLLDASTNTGGNSTGTFNFAGGISITNEGGKAYSTGAEKRVKYSADVQYTITLPEGLTIDSICFCGYDNYGEVDAYLAEVAGMEYAATDYVFPQKVSGTAITVAHGISFDTPVTGSITFTPKGKQVVLAIELIDKPEPETDDLKYRLGDVNQDGVLDIRDVTQLIDLILKGGK